MRNRGRARTCRRHKRCFASGAEAEEFSPVHACGSARTGRAGPSLDEPNVRVINRSMQKNQATGAVRVETAGQHHSVGWTDG